MAQGVVAVTLVLGLAASADAQWLASSTRRRIRER
jgi:hypothetical protein